MSIHARALLFIGIELAVPPQRVVEVADLVQDLGADELDLIELAMALEDAFRVSIPEAKRDAWRTVGDVLRDVEALAATSASEAVSPARAVLR
jgi:acyl carrier protein